jgi:pimeloyl-ACP methyl ester carboxylesterase
MAEACRRLWPEPVDLVGHDLGGGIAQIMAVRHPELVRSLTLVNTVGYDYWPVPLIASMRPPIISELLIGALDRGAFALVVRRAMFHKERVTEPFVAALQAPLRTALGRKAFQHFARSLDNRDLMEIVPGLRALHVPTTVVWGLADAYLTFAIAERLVADIPGARLERVETAGHYLPFDEPERLADTLHGRAHEPG